MVAAERIAEAKDAELDRVLGLNAGLRDELTIISSRQARIVPLSWKRSKLQGWIWKHSKVLFRCFVGKAYREKLVREMGCFCWGWVHGRTSLGLSMRGKLVFVDLVSHAGKH